MMRSVIALFVLSVLAACGVDGEPETPQVSGAVTISDGGVYPTVAVRQGWLSVYLGL